MKSRPNRITRLVSRRRRFALHPLSFAICLGLSGAALALPQGGTVVTGTATITTPTPTTQVIRQTTDRAIIDWRSFSIAAGERVRFYQPSSTSVTLNRVTGYDPSFILGQMSSNGRVFLVNPYGVVFGAGARVDVGGLVVSTLSIANNDFMAGRYSLTSVDADAPASRGAIRNEGTINAPGGTVVLAGPVVSNTGTITANGGRVGLVAANSVSVDVEGDGLLFFQANATEARNRLEQLGRIQADGGTVEMRAAARGAFADTVLNMGGVVQARSLGNHEGRVVIDGGNDGVVAVSGVIDASGTGRREQGGAVTVLGERILLADGARIDASGRDGGGTVRVGGDFHGANPDLHNAESVDVQSGVEIRADALRRGDGGTVAIWADGSTRYRGSISARGGERGGDGGFVEVSGRQTLDYDGLVDTRAPKGVTGTLLLDPTDISIEATGTDTTAGAGGTVTGGGGSPSTIKASTIESLLGSTNVVVDTAVVDNGAAGTITVNANINWTATTSLTLQAASSLTISPGVQITSAVGNLNLQATGNVLLNGSLSLGTGSLLVSNFAGALTGNTGAASFTSGAAGTITTAGGNVNIRTLGDINLGAAVVTNGVGGGAPTRAGDVTLNTVNGSIGTGAITANGGAGTSQAGGAVGGRGGNILITAAGTARTVNTGIVSAVGGTGSANSTANGTGGTGGAGGAVTITNNSTGNTTLASVTTTGGNGGAGGSGNSNGGTGGAAGAITASASAGTLTVNTLSGIGGAGGAHVGSGTDGAAGANAAINLNFGQASAGTLDLTGATIQGGTATATGGAGSDTILVADGAQNVALTNGLLTRPTQGNVNLANVENASITTGTGTLDASAFTGNVAVQYTASAGTITGNGGNTTLTGLAAGSTFAVTTANAGTIDSTTFSGVGSLVGGTAADSFTVSGTGSLSGSINGGTGAANSLTVTTAAANFGLLTASSGTASNVSGGYTNITSLTGNGTDSTLTGTNAASAYTVDSAGGGNVNGSTTFSGIASLIGGSLADSFSLSGTGSLAGSIDGGGGANSLTLTTAAADFGLTSATAGSVSNVTGGYSNIATLAGNGTTSTLTGSVNASVFTVTGNNAGTVGDVSGTANFSGIANLAGGAAADAFVLGAGFALASIDGGGGTNSLAATANPTGDLTLTNTLLTRTGGGGNVNLTGIDSASLTGGSGANAIGASGFGGPVSIQLTSGADSITGNGANTTLIAAAGGGTTTITALNAGNAVVGGTTTNFTGVGNLMGGAGVDTFVINTAVPTALSGNVTGVGGNDVLNLTGRAGAITITQSGTVSGDTGIGGTLSGINTFGGNGANTTFQGNDANQTYTVTGTNAFSVGAQNLVNVGSILAGNLDDVFVFQAGSSLAGSINGGAGSNTLNVAAINGNVALSSATSGNATGIGGSYSNIATLVGNGTTSTLTGTLTPSAFLVSGTNSGTVSGGGTTTFSGMGSLIGGAGADTFTIGAGGSLSGSIDGGAGAANALDTSALGTANFVLSSASSGNATGVGVAYSNITTLTGNGTTSTLTGTNAATAFAITGADSGTVTATGTTNFSGIASLVGGNLADSFTFTTPTSQLTGGINGGAGVNTLDLSALGTANFTLTTSFSTGTATNVGTGYSNIASLVGNGTSVLTGRATDSAYAVTGANSGTVTDVSGTTTFSGVASLIGGAGADSFALTGGGTLTGNVVGGLGANSLSLSAGTADFVLNTASSGVASGIGGTYAGITTLAGNNTNSTLTGIGADSTWTVSSTNTGTLNTGATTINFSGIRNLVGGNGNDNFVLGAGVGLGSIVGGSGSNTLTATANSGENLTLVDTSLGRSVSGPVSLTGIGAATLIGDGGANTITGIGWTGTLSLQLSAGNDSLTGNGIKTTLVADPAGGTITLTGPAAGQGNTSSGSTFSGIGNLRGNTGIDIFAIDGTGSLAGNLTGVGGNDTLDLTGKVGVVTINQGGSIVGSGIGGSITGISTVIGNGAGTSFVGTNTGQTYTVNGGDQFTVGGQTVNNVGTIVAGSGNDSFVFATGGHLGGSIDGGAGTNTLNVAAINGSVTLLTSTSGIATGIDNPYTNIGTLIGNGTTSTLTGANAANAFAVTGVNTGTVGTTNFSGMASLVGGNLADSFTFTTPTSQLTGSINGGAGVNTLNLSGLATADFTLTTNFSTGAATNVGGNYSNITTLVGNNSSSTLTGLNAGSTYAVTGANSGTLNDGVGTVNFSGVASLVGGSSPDVFNISGSLSGSINGGTGGTNTLNLSALSTADFGLNSASSGSASNVGLGYSNVTTLIGNNTSSTLTGTTTGSTYNVSGSNSGTVNDTFGTTTFSGVASLAGGIGADLFTIGGSLTGSINGGAGAGVNTLNLSGLSTANFVLTNASSGTASGVGVGGYSSITNLVGNGTSSTLIGSNNASTYSVTGNNTGTVTDISGTTSFTGVPRLVGGTAADSFVLNAGVALGSIDGGTGAANSLNDTATVSENLTLTTGQLARSTSGTVTLANIGSATLTGGTGNNTIDASGWTGGRTLVVNATTGADTVVGNGVGTTLLGMNAVSTFNLTGADTGTLTTGVNTTAFSGVGNLTGGSLADTFVIQNAGTLSGNLNGGGGQDTLDLSNKSSATLVFSSAGTDVSGAGIAGSTISIETFIGNVANTTLQGQATGQTFVITGDNEITVDGTQVFQGVGSLSAGTGVDNISGGALFHLAGSIFDAGGATNLSGTIRTDGSQTYLGAITAPSVTLAALGGLTAINAGNDFGAVSLTGGSINLRDTDAIDLLSVTVGAGQTLSIQSGSTITLNGNVATSANQSYTGNLLLATDAALSAGPGTIAITGNVNGGTHDLALTSTNASAAAISVGGTVGNVGTFAANGNARIGGNVTSTGTQTYTGTLALTNDATLDAGTGKVDLQQAVDGGGHNLTVTSGNAAADAVHVGGAVSNTAQFTANGASTIGANVATTGNQLYNGNVTLANNVTLDPGAATLRVQGSVNGGTHNLNLASSAAAANAIVVTGTIGNLGSFNALGNATLGGNVTSTGNQTYSGTVALSGDATLNAGGGKVDLQQAVNAGGHALGLTSSNVAADAIHAEATITNASQLTVTGRSTLATGVTTTGAQTYTDTVTLGSSSDFAGSSLGFGNGIVAGTFDLGLRADALSLAGTVSGSGNATLSTVTQGATIGIAGGAGTLQLSQATLDRFAGFTSLTLGRADGTGDLTFGNLVLPTQLAVVSGSGDANFTGTVASAASQGRDLTVHDGRHHDLRGRRRRPDRRQRRTRQPHGRGRHPARRRPHRQRQRQPDRPGDDRR